MCILRRSKQAPFEDRGSYKAAILRRLWRGQHMRVQCRCDIIHRFTFGQQVHHWFYADNYSPR